MRIGVALPNYGPVADPATLVRLARLAEDAGADGIWLSDHLVVPAASASVYPYDARPGAPPADLRGLERFFEPIVTLAWLAGQTRRVRLGVSAYVLPYRNPVLTAKHVATLDALCGGRVVLAVGTGWLREEFAALGVPFAARGRRTDDYLAVCSALWAGPEAALDTPTYRLPPVRSGPLPVQRPRPPVWIAGNSRAALDRAARLGDGWHGIDVAPAALPGLLDVLRARAAAHGRDPGRIAVTLRRALRADGPPGAPLRNGVDALRRLRDADAAAGVDVLVVGLGRQPGADAAARAVEAVLRALVPGGGAAAG